VPARWCAGRRLRAPTALGGCSRRARSITRLEFVPRDKLQTRTISRVRRYARLDTLAALPLVAVLRAGNSLPGVTPSCGPTPRTACGDESAAPELEVRKTSPGCRQAACGRAGPRMKAWRLRWPGRWTSAATRAPRSGCVSSRAYVSCSRTLLERSVWVQRSQTRSEFGRGGHLPGQRRFARAPARGTPCQRGPARPQAACRHPPTQRSPRY
jgi:hypothetical protein